MFFKILFRQGLDHATAVEAVGRIVGVPYSIIKAERFVVHGGAGLAERRGAEPAAQCPPRPRSDRPPPSSSPAAPTRRLRSRAGKRLMARVHGVMIVLRAGWRGVGRHELSWCKDRPTLWMRPGNHSITGLPVYVGLGCGKRLMARVHGVMIVLRAGWRRAGGHELSWCKDPPTRWIRPGHSSITGLPVCYRAGPSPVFCLCSRVVSRVEKSLTAWIHGVCLSSGQAGDALAGTNFPGVKILPTRWMRPGHSSITGLPVCYRAGSPAVAGLFVSFHFAERRSTAVSLLCFPELPPGRRGFCQPRQTG